MTLCGFEVFIDLEAAHGQTSLSSRTSHRPMPVRQGRIRDRRAGALGLARSFYREPSRARRGLCHICRELGQAFPYHERRKRDRALRAQGIQYHAQLLLELRHARDFFERPRSPHMVNIPRALFAERTGREPLYHIAIEELQEWTYSGEPLAPLKGFPGVVWQRSKEENASPATIRSSSRLTIFERLLACAGQARAHSISVYPPSFVMLRGPRATDPGRRKRPERRIWITGRSAFLRCSRTEGITHLFGNPGTPNCRSCMR